MANFQFQQSGRKNAYFISIGLVLIVSLICFFSTSFLGYKVVALILLLTVSLLAMLFDILPVLLAAALSALIWNFFFIPPLFTFHIDHAEDLLMFLLYFVIACVNAVLTFKLRKQEKKVRDKEEKENAIRLYNTLLNSLSHELRTPIATIIGSVDVLKEPNSHLSDAQQLELLNQIDLAGTRLNRQVENLLNMSRLETGMLKPKFDWCDLNELIFAVIQSFPDEHQKRITYLPDEQLPLFQLDRILMEQVLLNLVHNALNYTAEKNQIQIQAALASDYCKIIVSDNGAGIPEQELQHVFDKFYRLPHTKTGGSGLGLSIVKGFVEAHHGHITATNQKDGGACFTIEIPAAVSFINNLNHE